tara:strand:- start:75 stop:515 length:441 start_codon:yes stop_codon:yes gene_type:complete
MNIFFDVDYTIMSMDGKIRPHTQEVFSKFISLGHTIFIWSGVGLRHKDIDRLELSEYVSGIFVKPVTEYETGIQRFQVNPRPDFVIDDHPEIVEFFGGYHVSPYYFKNDLDQEILELFESTLKYFETGLSDSRKLFPNPHLNNHEN